MKPVCGELTAPWGQLLHGDSGAWGLRLGSLCLADSHTLQISPPCRNEEDDHEARSRQGGDAHCVDQLTMLTERHVAIAVCKQENAFLDPIPLPTGRDWAFWVRDRAV